MMKKFFTSTVFLTNGILFIGLIIIIGEAIIFQQIYGMNIPEKLSWILAGSGFPFWFTSFLFVFLRKEIVRPGLPGIKGAMARTIGAMGCLIFALAELFCIYNLILK